MTKTAEEIIELKMLEKYRKKGIKIGMATDDGSPLDQVEILKALNEYRKITKPERPEIKEIEVFDSPFAVTKKYPNCKFNNAYYGNHDIQWLIGGLCKKVEYNDEKITDAIYPLLKLANQIGWFWMDNNKVCVSRRPSKLSLRTKYYADKEELAANFSETSLRVGHNTNDHAIQYSDNTGVYILNGLRLPKENEWLITDKSKLTLSNIMKIKNTEIKNEALKLLPVDQFQEGAGYTVKHSFTVEPGGFYELREMLIDDEPRMYLKGTCPSKKEDFNEPVPPGAVTCQQALNWREPKVGQISTNIEDYNKDVYIPPVIRT